MLEMAGDAAKKSTQNPSSSAAEDCLAGFYQVSLPGWAIPVQEQPIYRNWWQVLFVSSSELSSWLSVSGMISVTCEMLLLNLCKPSTGAAPLWNWQKVLYLISFTQFANLCVCVCLQARHPLWRQHRCISSPPNCPPTARSCAGQYPNSCRLSGSEGIQDPGLATATRGHLPLPHPIKHS